MLLLVILSSPSEYQVFFVFCKFSATDVIKQLSGPLLVRMIHTRDGSRVGMLCVKHGSAKVKFLKILFDPSENLCSW